LAKPALRSHTSYISYNQASQLKANLHGTIFAYDCCMWLLLCVLLASGKDRIQLVILTFWFWIRLSKGFKTCFKILGHFFVLCDCHCRFNSHDTIYVVGMALAWHKHIACDKIVPCKSAFNCCFLLFLFFFWGLAQVNNFYLAGVICLFM